MHIAFAVSNKTERCSRTYIVDNRHSASIIRPGVECVWRDSTAIIRSDGEYRRTTSKRASAYVNRGITSHLNAKAAISIELPAMLIVVILTIIPYPVDQLMIVEVEVLIAEIIVEL